MLPNQTPVLTSMHCLTWCLPWICTQECLYTEKLKTEKRKEKKDPVTLLQESKIDMSELQLKAQQLAEMVGLIEDGTISGKIGKQILPDLLQARFHLQCLCVRTHRKGAACVLSVASSCSKLWQSM